MGNAMQNKYAPRLAQSYGQTVVPSYSPTRQTWIEGEMMCSDIGQFRRRGLAFHEKSGELVRFDGAIPDTYFSIPATTKTEHGYVTGREDGELEFRPHTKQTLSPVEYRKKYRERCK